MTNRIMTAGSFKHGIGRKLFLYILLFSLVLTIIGTSLQLYLEHTREVQSIKTDLRQIERTYLKGIISSLWLTDYELLRTQLEGILQAPNMQYLEVQLPDKNIISVGTPQSENIIQYQYPLAYTYKKHDVPLGTLRVVASIEGINKRLLSQFFQILATEAVKMFLISTLIFCLFYFMVGRHLKTMADYMRSLGIQRLDLPLNLKRAFRIHKDELDQLEFSINEMRKNLAQDIAERKRTEESLRKYKYIVSTTKDLMAFVDRNYVYRAANDAYLRAHGRRGNDVIGQSVLEVLGRDVFETLLKDRLNRSLNGEQVHFQTWFDFPGIGNRYIDAYYYPFFEDERSISGVVLSARDITEHKQVEEKLQQSQKMEAIGTLAGGIAHDFNNLLAPIIGYTDLAIVSMPEGSPDRENLLVVLKSAERAKELVQHILTFSRISEPEQKPLQIQPVVIEALKLLRSSLPSTIEIRENIDVGCGPILADPVQMHQIVMNLCTNAYHAMREKGGILDVNLSSVEVSANSLGAALDLIAGTYVKLEVSDTGHGMDREVMDRVFDPYFTTKSTGDGTGMGLAVVHGIVESHGGAISVYSKPGEGSTFDVYFPQIDHAGIDTATADTDTYPRGHERLLLVDDEEAIVRMVQKMLEFLGYQVTPLNNSEEALKVFCEQPGKFDLVITDQTMPGLTGGKLAEKLMEIRADIPIILCTGFSYTLTREKALAAGISAYIMKPVTMREIAETIRRVLDENKNDVEGGKI